MITMAYEVSSDYIQIESDKRPGLSLGYRLNSGEKFKQFTSQYVITESDLFINQINEDAICVRQIVK
ncbi:MAG: hypothetical protein QG651_839 [Pseudomonadota bacterium]|jgi:hypothetical protein|nr:hypothetical protein [Pseudomonadota bacterium]MDQ5948345.1 hypothetical protein [Pseudomonadota bacterium]